MHVLSDIFTVTELAMKRKVILIPYNIWSLQPMMFLTDLRRLLLRNGGMSIISEKGWQTWRSDQDQSLELVL